MAKTTSGKKSVKISRAEAVKLVKAAIASKKGYSKLLLQQGFSLEEIKSIKQEISGKQSRIKPTSVSEVSEVEPTPKEEKTWVSKLQYHKDYVYNEKDDLYVMYLKAAGGSVKLPGATVRQIADNYSNWTGNAHTINEVCRNHSIPRNYLVEILRVLGITHDKEPFTSEALESSDVESLAAQALEQKRFNLYQKFQRQDWASTEAAAEKWNQFQQGVLDPVQAFLEHWTPPAYKAVKPPVVNKGKHVFIAGISDVHFGSKANKNDSWRGKDYSTQQAVDGIIHYAESIAQAVGNRNYQFSECVVAAVGDIIHTTGTGFTAKGTMLVHDCLKEEQFNSAFDAMVQFLDKMLATFPKVRVESVKGNHNDFGDYVLFKALAAYYRTEKRISFSVYQTDHGIFKAANTLFVISHGYSAEYKARLPKGGPQREAYVTNLFLAKPEALLGVTQKVFLTADQHHLEMREYAEFEHYMLSTMVKGDKHSEASGLNNKARQSSFILNDDGIQEIIYTYTK